MITPPFDEYIGMIFMLVNWKLLAIFVAVTLGFRIAIRMFDLINTDPINPDLSVQEVLEMQHRTGSYTDR